MKSYLITGARVLGGEPTDLLVRHDLMKNTKPYALTVDTRYESPAHELVKDVVSGEVDVGFIWGPIAGYFAKHSDVPLVVTPIDSSEPGMSFAIGVGVRKKDTAFAKQLEAVLDRERPAIQRILDDYGVPRADKT